MVLLFPLDSGGAGVFLPLFVWFWVFFFLLCVASLHFPKKIKPIELLGDKLQVVVAENLGLIWHFCLNLIDKSKLVGYLHEVHTNSPQKS